MRLNKTLLYLSALLGLILTAPLSFAHPGGRDAEGCHTCRTNCAKHGLQDNERHCHTGNESKPKPAQQTPEILPHLDPAGHVWINDKLLQLNYDGFSVWLDCSKRGAMKFQYNAQRDLGDEKRGSRFYPDPEVPARCQQTSAKSYKPRSKTAPRYDRGHLVPANHLDASKAAIRQSNFMTNILPQVATMNRGAWLRTEEIVECYRDIDELLVIGGAIWGTNTRNDHFKKSHGIETPDAYWKVVIRGDGRVIAWIIPNSVNATKKKLDDYLVSVREVEQQTGETIPVDEFRKDEKLDASWQIPYGCDKS